MKQYDREFKVQAVQLCTTSDKPVAQVAREMGINPKLLYLWRDEFERSGEDAYAGNGQQRGEAKELAQLQRDLARVTMAPRGFPDILKKALSVFAQPST